MSAVFLKDDGKNRIPHDKKSMFLHYDEESVRSRKTLTRGMGTLQQLEFTHVFSKDPLDIPEVKRPLYAGTNQGTSIGPVVLEKFEDMDWQVTLEDKRKLYGSHRVAVGGPSEDSGDTGPDAVGRVSAKGEHCKRKAGLQKDKMYEPFSFHGLPPCFYEDRALHSITYHVTLLSCSCSLMLAYRLSLSTCVHAHRLPTHVSTISKL